MLFHEIPHTLPDTPLLDTIESPQDLRGLNEEQLPELANQLREYLLYSVGQTGGHFGAGLGVVELTIALHYLYNTPDDKLVWDVGHQTYPHKILTGRRKQMLTIRKKDGLSGFPKRDESPFDTFGVGHSSTSIGAALGMCEALKQQKDDRQVVAILGDGAMTAGMAYEALNHGGDLYANLLVILNDNEMSISENVGGLPKYLSKVLSTKTFFSMREEGKKILQGIPPMWEFAKRTETHMKGMMVPGTLFEEMGFNYVGPVDGHSLPDLMRTLENLKTLKGPRLLHVITKKGKGYPPAEAAPIKYHAVSPGFYDKKSDKPKTTKTPVKKSPTYSQVFGQWLCDMAELEKDWVAITPAMREGSGMVEFAQKYPDLYYDVGIAEQHSVTFAAGMACEGIKPVVAIYSSFLQRAYDQLVHDVALQNLPVLFAIDRAGLVGGDGPTHAGSFDLSFLRCIPNMVVMAPSNEDECRQMLYTGFKHQGPAAVRYPRGTGPNVAIQPTMEALPIGKAEILRQGKQIAILAFGSMVAPAMIAGEHLNAIVVNMRFVKPLDIELIEQIAQQVDMIVTVEENTRLGGAGSGVNEVINELQLHCSVTNLGLPDEFLGHGSPGEMLSDIGLNTNGILEQIRAKTNHLSPKVKPTKIIP